MGQGAILRYGHADFGSDTFVYAAQDFLRKTISKIQALKLESLLLAFVFVAAAWLGNHSIAADGILLNRTGTTVCPFGFQGEYTDADTGLVYLRARWMNPQTGRFMGMDEYEGDQEDPLSLHKYLYVKGDGGVNASDPNGHDENGINYTVFWDFVNLEKAASQAATQLSGTLFSGKPTHMRVPQNTRSVTWDGLTFDVPESMSLRHVFDDGQKNQRSAFAIARYVAPFGKWDIQRNLGNGVQKDFDFYDYYVGVSNFDVGLYMNGAGWSVKEMISYGTKLISAESAAHPLNYSQEYQSRYDRDVPFWKAGWDYAQTQYR